MSRPVRLGAIDVGSNTILLLIAEYRPPAELHLLEEAEDQPRLGSGLSQSGHLSAEAMDRALQSLIRMHGICRRHGVDRMSAVATAAVREAENGAEFVERARALGVPLRIISPETEAALAYRSAAHRFPRRDRLLVADIGGGSLELVGAAEGRVQLSESLPLGAVRLTELELPLPALREHIRPMLTTALPTTWKGGSVIGSGGTFATLAGMVLAQRGMIGAPIHGVEVAADELEALIGLLSRMSPEQRRRVPGIRPERADIIVPGLAVIAELLGRVAAPAATISGFGLRDGLLLEMIESGGEARASTH